LHHSSSLLLLLSCGLVLLYQQAHRLLALIEILELPLLNDLLLLIRNPPVLGRHGLVVVVSIPLLGNVLSLRGLRPKRRTLHRHVRWLKWWISLLVGRGEGEGIR